MSTQPAKNHAADQRKKNLNQGTGSQVRQELIKLLSGFLQQGQAHITFEDAVKGISPDYYGKRPRGLPYSLWQEVSHIQITQKDILEFCRDPHYQSPRWPEGYWPSDPAPSGETEWKESIKAIIRDRKEFINLLGDASVDLFQPFPHGNGQNLVREALLIVDHTSYHVGEIIVIRRLLGIYK